MPQTCILIYQRLDNICTIPSFVLFCRRLFVRFLCHSTHGASISSSWLPSTNLARHYGPAANNRTHNSLHGAHKSMDTKTSVFNDWFFGLCCKLSCRARYICTPRCSRLQGWDRARYISATNSISTFLQLTCCADSSASKWQSRTANIERGSIFSTLQSAGAGGKGAQLVYGVPAASAAVVTVSLRHRASIRAMMRRSRRQ